MCKISNICAPKETQDYYKVFFDFETDTSDFTHKPYLVRFETEDNEQQVFMGDYCAIDMLNNLPDKKIYFVNST